METRIAAVSIIIENYESVEKVNDILHEYRKYIIGRMGLPYKKRDIAIICIVMDAPNNVTSALSGKLGMVPQITAKVVYSKQFIPNEMEGMP